jgi:hypothetical protein
VEGYTTQTYLHRLINNTTYISGETNMFGKGFFKSLLQRTIPRLFSPPQIEDIPEKDHGKRLRSTRVVGKAGSRESLRRLHFGTFSPCKPFKHVSRWV